MWHKLKTLLTRNNRIKYWELSIGMRQSFSANEVCERLRGVSDNREDDQWGGVSDLR